MKNTFAGHPSRFRFVSLAALFLSYAACVWSFVSSDEGLSPWTAAFVLYAALTTVCFAGLRLFQKWAWTLSAGLAFIALGFGFYAAHFAWTFWIFEEPSFVDRVLALLRPQIFLFTAVPVLWLFWIFNPFNRKLFLNSPGA